MLLLIENVEYNLQILQKKKRRQKRQKEKKTKGVSFVHLSFFQRKGASSGYCISVFIVILVSKNDNNCIYLFICGAASTFAITRLVHGYLNLKAVDTICN